METGEAHDLRHTAVSLVLKNLKKRHPVLGDGSFSNIAPDDQGSCLGLTVGPRRSLLLVAVGLWTFWERHLGGTSIIWRARARDLTSQTTAPHPHLQTSGSFTRHEAGTTSHLITRLFS